MMSRVCSLSVAVGLLAMSGCTEMVADAPVAAEPVALAAFNAADAPTVEFKVPDMMCEDSCATAVADILSRQPGVMDVEIDFAGKTAKVAIDEGKFDSQQALAELVDKGFDNSALVVDDELAKLTADFSAEQASSCCDEPDSCCEEPGSCCENEDPEAQVQ